jgi:hypothetical protein
MIAVATLVLVLAAGAALVLWLGRRLSAQGADTARALDQLLAVRNREVDGRLEAITATMDRRRSARSARPPRRWPSRRRS